MNLRKRIFHVQGRLFCLVLSLSLLAAIAAAGFEPIAPTPTGPDSRRPMNRRPMPKAEWAEPDHGAPNGTQYKTFPSKVLGRDVS